MCAGVCVERVASEVSEFSVSPSLPLSRSSMGARLGVRLLRTLDREREIRLWCVCVSDHRLYT